MKLRVTALAAIFLLGTASLAFAQLTTETDVKQNWRVKATRKYGASFNPSGALAA